MFKVIRLRTILIVVAFVLSVVLVSVGIATTSVEESPKPIYTIVLDAGHGGRDDGCSGANGTKESEINLKVAKILEGYLKTLGVRVVMTRLDGNGLYKSNATNFKVSDMEKRIEIITDAKPDMVISIHQNAYSDPSQHGAQAFFQPSDETSKIFAESVQTQLISVLNSPRLSASAGDYYILNETPYPAVLVECGYLTNPAEESLLRTTDYQQKVAYAIMCGVVKYLNFVR